MEVLMTDELDVLEGHRQIRHVIRNFLQSDVSQDTANCTLYKSGSQTPMNHTKRKRQSIINENLAPSVWIFADALSVLRMLEHMPFLGNPDVPLHLYVATLDDGTINSVSISIDRKAVARLRHVGSVAMLTGLVVVVQGDQHPKIVIIGNILFMATTTMPSKVTLSKKKADYRLELHGEEPWKLFTNKLDILVVATVHFLTLLTSFAA